MVNTFSYRLKAVLKTADSLADRQLVK